MRPIHRLAWVIFAISCGGGADQPDALPAPDADTSDGAVIPDAPPGQGLRIEFLDPDHGPFSGGTEVIIRGKGFAEGMTITFDGRMVEPLDVQVVDDRRVVVITPAGDPGPAEVAVQVGAESASLPDAFFYESIYVDPPTGSVAGGTYVVIQGFGTSFVPGDTVLFDGRELQGTQVLGEQQIVGFTPPGFTGHVDVTVDGAAGEVTAEDGFTYTMTADPFDGGMGGGPIAGTLNIAVVDATTEDGVDGAYVVVGDPTTSPYTGLTDPFGQITFSDPTLVGPVSVTAAAAGYETSSIVVFDARDLTIFLVPIPDPMPGPLPPGRQVGTINGHIVFGGVTGLGSSTWDLVPEPRTATEVKRAYVMTTMRDPFTGNPDPGFGSVVSYTPGSTSWAFSIYARPAALAVVAVAGLYDPAVDPDGPGGPLPAGVFSPFAMGAARGVLVGPAEIVENVDVLVDIPLDTALEVELDNPPPLNTPGQYGPTEYDLQAYIDLGGEGVISLPGSTATLPPGSTETVLPGLAPIVSNISDSSYTVFAGAYSAFLANPWSVRVVRGVNDLSVPLVVTDFLGTPRPVDPPNGGMASYPHLQFAPEGGTGSPTFNIYLLQGLDGTPLWRMYTNGDQFDVPFYDLAAAAGLPAIPTDQVVWVAYEITVPGLDFESHWTYRDLNSNFWSAYAADAWIVSIPPYP